MASLRVVNSSFSKASILLTLDLQDQVYWHKWLNISMIALKSIYTHRYSIALLSSGPAHTLAIGNIMSGVRNLHYFPNTLKGSGDSILGVECLAGGS
jgi:hypothetical protein